MSSRVVVYKDGTKRWCKDNKFHRVDGPAIEWVDGIKEWWYKGIYVGKGDKPNPTLWERLTSVEINGGPLLNGCVVDLFGVKRWYKDDLRHREDGPAVEGVGEVKEWYLHGKFLNYDSNGFWTLWELLTDEQRGSPNLLRYMPR